ncbi:hypothetical protein [Streptomyces sp. NPDC059142]|uniref:hypothetical protein n=1 Tax=Streptomyces sp. NPDC059142 TaxID=3346739 RepID=UPI0036C49EEA
MSENDDIRATFLFHPPVDDAAAWHMTLEGFVRVLTETFPDAFTKYRTSPLRGSDAVDFEVEIAPGTWLEGVAQTPVEDSAVVTLVGATAHEAAEFALWIRSKLLPSPGLLRFGSDRAMESGHDAEWLLPPSDEAAEVEAAFLDHLESVR